MSSVAALRITALTDTTATVTKTYCSTCARRSFSSTAPSYTRARRVMFAWLNGPGENFRNPVPNSTNYLTQYDERGAFSQKDDASPFPMNPSFQSQSILSEALRQEIWKRIQVDKKSVRQVSVELGVEMRRVGAVVRLVDLERRVRAEGKPLALPYAQAIYSMVPTTPYDPANGKVVAHEPINDLPVHPLTNAQIFYPTSESRDFTRIDAGRVFSGAPRLLDEQITSRSGKPKTEPWQDNKNEWIGKKGNETPVLKPADARIPHPQLVAFEQDKRNPEFKGESETIKERYAQRLYDDARDREELLAKKLARREASQTAYVSDRFQFIVTEAQVTRENTGLDGRGTKSPGFRYGVPSHDRKRGQLRVPTRVEV